MDISRYDHRAFQVHADNVLVEQNLMRIESNKDRQEGAILVFTIVTIIFLPLSFVASFFGMNTIDIRNQDNPQWVFWASAVPLTAVVVGFSLFVARKIDSIKETWSSIIARWGTQEAPEEVWPPTAAGVQQPDYSQPQARTSWPTRRRRSIASIDDVFVRDARQAER